MSQLFLRTTVICAAVFSFAAGAFLVASGAETQALQRIEAYFNKLQVKDSSTTSEEK